MELPQDSGELPQEDLGPQEPDVASGVDQVNDEVSPNDVAEALTRELMERIAVQRAEDAAASGTGEPVDAPVTVEDIVGALLAAEAAKHQEQDKSRLSDQEGPGRPQTERGAVPEAQTVPRQPERVARPAPPPIGSLDGQALSTEVTKGLQEIAVAEHEQPDEAESETTLGAGPSVLEVNEDRVVASGGTAGEKNLEGAGRGKINDGIDGEHTGGRLEPVTKHRAVDSPRVTQPEDEDKVTPISSPRPGPDRVTQQIAESAYGINRAVAEAEGLQTTHGPAMAGIAQLFAKRARDMAAATEHDPDEPPDGKRIEPQRVSFVGSGPGDDAAYFLGELAQDTEVYEQTVVEVSDLHPVQVDAARSNPRLLAHMDAAHGGTAATNHVEFAVRDASHPEFYEGQVPHLVVASNTLSSLPAHTITADDNVYGGDGTPTGDKLEKPVLREVHYVDGVGGNRDLVRFDTADGVFARHPVGSIRPAEYLNQLQDPAERQRLLAQLMGRLVVALSPQSTANELTDRELGAWYAPDAVTVDRHFLEERATNGTVIRRYYNYAPGTAGFVEGTLGRVDRPEGMIVCVLDDIRTRPTGNLVREPGEGERDLGPLNGIGRYDGAVARTVVEGWLMARLARQEKASVRMTSGEAGDWHMMLFDGADSIKDVLEMETAFGGILGRVAEVIVEREAIKVAMGTRMINAWQMYPHRADNPEENEIARAEFALAGLEEIYHDVTEPSLRGDYRLWLDIATECTNAKLYEPGRRFAQRAVDLAGNSSFESYRALAAALFGLGQSDAGLNSLKLASEIAPDSAAVWQDLKNVYREQGQWGDFVIAAENYFNTARNLGSKEVIELMFELCRAKEYYAIQERENRSPHTAIGARLQVRATPMPDAPDRWLYLPALDDRVVYLPTNAQLAKAAHTAYLTAIDAARALYIARNVSSYSAEGRRMRHVIEQLQQGERSTAGIADQLFRLPQQPESITVLSPLASTKVGAPLALGGLADEEEYLQTVVDDEATVAQTRYEKSESSMTGPPSEADTRYIHNLHELLQIQLPVDDPQAATDELTRIAAEMWEGAADAGIRVRIGELLVGRQIQGPHAHLMSAKLKGLLRNGGPFESFMGEMSTFYNKISTPQRATR